MAQNNKQCPMGQVNCMRIGLLSCPTGTTLYTSTAPPGMKNVAATMG